MYIACNKKLFAITSLVVEQDMRSQKRRFYNLLKESPWNTGYFLPPLVVYMNVMVLDRNITLKFLVGARRARLLI